MAKIPGMAKYQRERRAEKGLVQIGVEVDVGTYNWMKQYAEQDGVTMATIVRNALDMLRDEVEHGS